MTDPRQLAEKVLSEAESIEPWNVNGREVQLARELLSALDREARWLEWSDGQCPDDSPGDVIAAEQDGTITLDDGVTTWNPLRAVAFFAARAARAAAYEQALRRIMDELGVPNSAYPASISNAYYIAIEALAAAEETKP